MLLVVLVNGSVDTLCSYNLGVQHIYEPIDNIIRKGTRILFPCLLDTELPFFLNRVSFNFVFLRQGRIYQTCTHSFIPVLRCPFVRGAVPVRTC